MARTHQLCEWIRCTASRIFRVAIVLSAMLLAASSLFAYDVLLKNGFVIHFQKYRVADGRLFYVTDGGKEDSVLLSDINMDATHEMNTKADPPLQLPGLNAAKVASGSQTSASLGDLARQMRPKNGNTESRRVYTNDDFHSSPGPTAQVEVSKGSSNWSATRARMEEYLRGRSGDTEQEFASEALGRDLANVQFPYRAAWQSDLYRAHQKYIADGRLCISDRVSDAAAAQNAACARLNLDEYEIESLQKKGREAAEAWKSRQEKMGTASGKP